MQRFLVGRLLQACGVLLVVSIITFGLIHAAPGGPALLLQPVVLQLHEQALPPEGLLQPAHEVGRAVDVPPQEGLADQASQAAGRGDEAVVEEGRIVEYKTTVKLAFAVER